MSKRFGRNQKRKMREQLAEVKSENFRLQDYRFDDMQRIRRLKEQLRYIKERPVLMSINSQRPCDPSQLAVFCIDISPQRVQYMRLDSRQLYSFIANELSRAVLSEPKFRGLITPHKHPTCDINKIMEF